MNTVGTWTTHRLLLTVPVNKRTSDYLNVYTPEPFAVLMVLACTEQVRLFKMLCVLTPCH